MKWLVLGSLVALWARPGAAPARRASGGELRGLLAPAGGHVAYLGVPYAYTDTRHRFQDPLPVGRWNGTRDAINEHYKCPQRFTSHLVLGQEDCLTLNVFVPLNAKGQLPVMVFFHGGGFREGSNSPFLYGPDYLVKKNVILVTANYRVEILGFLCLGIEEAPGNAGLKDQVAALKWVQENIKEFNGDPNDVTIFGESAGASSVSYHILSPMSKGLFHKAIMQSGTAITPWSFQYDPVETASLLARQMGYNTMDPKELYKIFMNKTPEELLKTRVPRSEGNVIMSETIFTPCVEKVLPGIQPFLTDYPYNILEKGDFNKVPMIIGYNSAEGYMFAAKENDTTIQKLSFVKALPRDLEFPTAEERNRVAATATELYLHGEEISKRTLAKISRFHGEPFFKYPVIATIDLMSKHNVYPMYNYRFSYDGWLNIAKFFYGFGKEPGATHADELFYLFRPQFPTPWRFEKLMIDRMTTMWTNFAKYGDPTPSLTSSLPRKWLPTSKSDPRVLVIDREFSTAPLFDSKAIKFWHETYAKYRRKV